MTIYRIIARHSESDDWDPDPLGGFANEFATEKEAWQVIEELLQLGPDWADVEYSVQKARAWDDDELLWGSIPEDLIAEPGA